MIQIHSNKSSYAYDIHSLVQAFYPGEDVIVFSDEDDEKRKANVKKILAEYEKAQKDQCSKNIAPAGEANKEKDAVLMAQAQDEKMDLFFTDTEIRIRIGHESLTILIPEDTKETKNKLKRAVYEMLAKRTGRQLPWGTLTGIRPTKIPLQMLEAGKEEDEIEDFMYDTYLCSGEKTDLAISIAQRELRLLKQLDYENGYSLYIGIPFCPSTCLYCSFTSYPLQAWKNRVDLYLDALEKELTDIAVRFVHKKLNTIYIGGGTPTTLEPPQLDRLIRKIKCSFDLSYLKEFTVEAGRPDSITKEKLVVLKRHGVTRISINPQTMKQETLDIIGRHHTVEQTIAGFKLAREMGFDNINMDLIMGLPDETIDDVRHTMEVLTELKPDNVTVHSLAIKRAARLNMFKDDYKQYQLKNTSEQMNLTAACCERMGLYPYYLYRQKNMAGNFENVGYALPGKAGIYNVLIMEEVQTIVACGAGTVTKRVWAQPDENGSCRIERCDNVKEVSQYIERIDEMIERKRKLFL